MANFRLAYALGIALKMKAAVQHLAKSYPKEWNGKIKYHAFCADEIEQGWAIKIHHNNRVFSIAFTGVFPDKVKVYSGKGDLNYPGNVPPKSHDQKSFPAYDKDAVAKYILTLIEEFFKEV